MANLPKMVEIKSYELENGDFFAIGYNGGIASTWKRTRAHATPYDVKTAAPGEVQLTLNEIYIKVKADLWNRRRL